MEPDEPFYTLVTFVPPDPSTQATVSHYFLINPGDTRADLEAAAEAFISEFLQDNPSAYQRAQGGTFSTALSALQYEIVYEPSLTLEA